MGIQEESQDEYYNNKIQIFNFCQSPVIKNLVSDLLFRGFNIKKKTKKNPNPRWQAEQL